MSFGHTQHSSRFSRERRSIPLETEEATSLIFGVLHYTWLKYISRKFFWVISPVRVSHDKSFCSLCAIVLVILSAVLLVLAYNF